MTTKILMTIPTRGGVHENTSAVASKLESRPDVEFAIAKGRPEDYTRNGSVRVCLENRQFTHLFFIDSDTEPPLDCIDRLLALDAPLASGIYPLLMPSGLKWSVSNRGTDGKYRLIDRTPSEEPFMADAGGAGCLLIRRDVFDRVKWPWFKWIEKQDGSQISEDIYFFKKANFKGLRLKVDPQVICNHYKEVNLTAFMRAALKNRNYPAKPAPQIINNQ